MTRTVPILRDGMLTYQQQGVAYTVAVGTPAWEHWLLNATMFIVELEQGTFTARKERAGNRRGGWYWRAYHRCEGTLHRSYIGKAEEITLARLRETAALLAAHSQASVDHVALATSEQSPWHQRRTLASRHIAASVRQQVKKHATSRRHHPILLTTKLSLPFMRPQVVVRPRLYARLQEVTRHKLLLISAPAGFGKTTALSAWASAAPSDWLAGEDLSMAQITPQQASIAWLSLDEGDNDPTSFWTYCIAALDTIKQGIGDDALALLASGQAVVLPTMLTVLINALCTLSNDFVLVLDDYHIIETPAIHEALAFLLDHMPAQMHLLIASRLDPPLPLARLRARHDLLELRAADLRFTTEEAADFLRQTMGLALPLEAVAALEARTEGWIAGLQLAALSLQGQEDSASFIATFAGSHRHVLDYLAEEVFARQPEPVQSFLLRTCILERLNGPLCDALSGQSHGQAMLTMLERKNLFIVPLDDQRTWYRYHHLFAGVLRTFAQRVLPARIPALHQQASCWYEHNGLIREAIEHAIASADTERAATLIEQFAGPTIWTYGEMVTLQRWLAPLPEEVVRSRPRLCILRAWIHIYAVGYSPVERDAVQAALDMAEACLQDAQQQLAPDDERLETQTMRGEIAALFSLLFCFRGDFPRMKEPACLALTLLPGEHTTLRCIAARMLCNLYEFYGDTTMIEPAVQELMTISQTAHDVIGKLNALFTVACCQVMRGDLHRAAASHRAALDQAERQLKIVSIASPHSIGLGSILLEWNDLAGAERYLLPGIESLKKRGDPGVLADGYRLLASLRLAQGDIDGTLAAIEEEEQVIQRSHQSLPPMFYTIAAAQRAWLSLTRGDLPAANQWASPYTHILDDDERFTLARSTELTTLAHIYLANNTAEAALQIVTRLLEVAEEMQRVDSIIQLLALQALAFSAQGHKQQAISTLARALVLAEPGGYIRAFVSEGAPMSALLLQVREALQDDEALSIYNVSPTYVQTLLAASRKPALPQATPQKHSASIRSPHKAPRATQALSAREREIVRLMAAGLSDREIAQHLVLAENTVKTYAKRIYAKLDVKNRTQAVTHAVALKIL
ncbi:MAG: helix-turn-helix transcriptional regulator [Ktedonobacteraceae bacterium]|nr:helix-turn-helix transcriptional regulator [Ktedonobacteraceae bacterium]